MKAEEWMRIMKTAALMSSYTCVGMGVMIIGPTLLDLSQQTSESLTAVSVILTVRTACYFIGSSLSESPFHLCV